MSCKVVTFVAFLCANALAIPVSQNRPALAEGVRGSVELYDRNGGSGSVLCALDWTEGRRVWDFDGNYPCRDDRARSMRIDLALRGAQITVYDDSDGDREDAYTVIKVLRDIKNNGVIIDSFQRSFTTEDVAVTFYRGDDHDDGGRLDGDVSRVEVTNS